MLYPNVDWTLVPDHMQDGIVRYIENGIQPGGFMRSVLENDLAGAFMRADHINKPRIGDIVEFVYMYLPSQCWGSPHMVDAWIASGGIAGHVRDAILTRDDGDNFGGEE